MSAAEPAADPFALNEDGTAKDPVAFQAALRADPAKLEALEKEPEVAQIILGDDINGFQELIKNVYQVGRRRQCVCGGAGRAAAPLHV